MHVSGVNGDTIKALDAGGKVLQQAIFQGRIISYSGETPVIIECPYCAAQVDAKEVAAYEPYVDEEDPDFDPESHFRVTLLTCIRCKNVLLAREHYRNWDEDDWSAPKRVYPPPSTLDLPMEIPANVRDSITDAKKCLKVEAYGACAVMCGRAIEGICRHFGAGPNLGTGLRELQRRGIIDSILFDWGGQVQLHRNLGAHATEVPIGEQDAIDLFDFSYAICQYVFVLGEKYRRFRDRRNPAGQNDATGVQ
jgi:hypothetical protein